MSRTTSKFHLDHLQPTNLRMPFPRIIMSKLPLTEITRIQLDLEMHSSVVPFKDRNPVPASEHSATVRTADVLRAGALDRVGGSSVPEPHVPGVGLGQGQFWGYKM